MIQTYKDSKSGKIYTESGEYIPNLEEYSRRVRGGEISGQPKDISEMPKVIRTSDGGVGTLTTNLSNIGKLQSNTAFLQSAKDIIARKQSIQQPLSEAKTYWRTLQKDTSPFGGERDANLQIPGMFTDERMRELSPADQASVRASRDAAASAHLQGIQEEEKYRETRAEDMVSAMSDLLTEKDKIDQQAMIDEERKLDIIKKKKDLGMPISDDDYKGAGLDATGGKVGGTISWRYNNPGNIKFGTFAESYGATKGAAATDGGFFAIFPDVATGEKARRDLLLGKNYSSLDPNTAMLRWSGGLDKNGKPNGKGYTYDRLVNLGAPAVSKPFSQFTDSEWAQLEAAWKQAEGWKEGTTLDQPNKVEHVTWTEAAARALAAKIPGKSSTELWNNYTDAELDELAKGASGDIVGQIVSKIKPAALLRIGLTQNDAREILTLKQMQLSDDEIKAAMTELNLDPKVLDELNKLLTSQENTSDIFALFSLLGAMNE
ncbi:MAG: hypothetical protein WC511_07045 [Candidatus Pacearchaeota archaeon]